MTARNVARRETVILALLSYRPGGWSVNDLQAHMGGLTVGLYSSLEHLEATGQVRSWFVDGPPPRKRLYDVATRPTPVAAVAEAPVSPGPRSTT